MRLMHTMLRVGNLQRSIDFYGQLFGMQVLKQSENTEYRYTLAFLGYQDINTETVLELTYNWDTHHYALGDGFGHLAFGVKDIYSTCERLQQQGCDISRAPGPVKGGNTLIAFVKDPDGYAIELIQE